MSLKVIKTFMLLSLVHALTSGLKHKNDNGTDRFEGSCSISDYTNKAHCLRTDDTLVCIRGFTRDWIQGVRYEISHLKLLDWPDICIDVCRLQTNFPLLRTLEISNSTKLKYFHGYFDSLSKIKEISMHGLASLWEVPGELVERMTELRVLDLRNNVLRHMKFNLIRGPPRLETVYLGDNKWDCSDGGLDWLAMENENGTTRKKIVDYYQLMCHQQLYRGKPLHKIMDIIRTIIETCPKPCTCAMTHVVFDPNGAVFPLITVNCTNKQLEDPPASIPPSTTTLRLEGNKDYYFIMDIKGLAPELTNGRRERMEAKNMLCRPHLEWDDGRRMNDEPLESWLSSIRELVQNPQFKTLMDLHLDNNSIQAVKELEGSEWFSTFRVLSLRGNMLKQIPVYAFDKAFQGNNNIMHVYLGGNPWRCDCHFIPRFQSLLLKYKRVIRDLKDIRCAKSDDKTISFVQISTIALGNVCSSKAEMPISIINIVNLVLLVLILAVVGKFTYDWHRFRATGKLPWISSVLP